MKKILMSSILVLFITVFDICATDLWSFDADNNGTINHTEFNEALLHAGNGDGYLFVRDGNYYMTEYLEIKKPVIVEGQSRDNTIIYLSRTANADGSFINTDNVVIKNLKITSNETSAGRYLVKLRGSNITFESVDFKLAEYDNSKQTAAIVFDSSLDNLMVSDCYFENIKYPFLKDNKSNTQQSYITVQNSTFYNCKSSANFNSPNHDSVALNSRMSHITIKDNIFNDDWDLSQLLENYVAEGTNYDHAGVSLANCKDVIIENNQFLNFEKEAIHIEDSSSHVVIEHNTIVGAAHFRYGAIWIIHGSHDITVRDNTIISPNELISEDVSSQRGYSIQIAKGGPSSYYVRPYNIEIIENEFQLYEDNIAIKVEEGGSNISSTNNSLIGISSSKTTTGIVVQNSSKLSGTDNIQNVDNLLHMYTGGGYEGIIIEQSDGDVLSHKINIQKAFGNFYLKSKY